MFTLQTTQTHVIILVSLCEVIVMVGGYDSNEDVDDIVCFDPVNNKWKTVGHLPWKAQWPAVVKSGE